MKNHHLFIPENLDCEMLARRFSQYYPTIRISPDHFAFFFETLIKGVPSGLSHGNSSGWTKISSQRLQSHIRHYDKMIVFLNSLGLIEVIWQFEPGVRCRQYRISEALLNPVTAVTFKSLMFQKKVNKNRNKMPRKRCLSPCKKLDQWFTRSGLEIDSKITNQIFEDIANRCRIHEVPSSIRYHERFKAMRSSFFLERMLHQQATHGRDHTSGRYHSPLTNLSKEFRPTIKHQGQTLVQVDLVNSQPYLLQSITQPDRLLHKIYPLIHQYLPYQDMSSFTTLAKTLETPTNTGIEAYQEDVNSGSFYEKFGSHLQIHLGIVLERSELKTAIFQTLFSDNRFKPPILGSNPRGLKRMFELIYPEVYKYVRAIKRKKKNTLAVLLQALEAYLIIDRCCTRFTQEHPKVPIFTIHDSMITLSEYIPHVERIIEEEFTEVIGHPPKLSIEPWVYQDSKSKRKAA